MAIFIPKKLKVGYQIRNDTFTGKLAYINYENDKKVWALEKSWKSWIKEKQIDFIDNQPLSGFIVNRSQTRYASFAGKSVNIRIYHPYGFEFEISPDNLCAVLSHCDISHSYINQECILGWEGGRVLLIPTNSDVYQSALQDTKNKLSKFEDDFIFGQSYIAKKLTKDNLIYLGKVKSFIPEIKTWDYVEKYIQLTSSKERKGHLFYNTITKDYEFKTASQIAEENTPVSLEKAQNLLLKFKENPLYKDIYSLPTISFTQDSETLKRMFIYTLLQRIVNYGSHHLNLSAIEKSQLQQTLDKACSQGIVLNNDINFGLKIMNYEASFQYRNNAHSKFDYAIALYTTEPINVFKSNSSKGSNIMAYEASKEFAEFLLEYNTTKKEVIFNNGYSRNFLINNHCLSIISNFIINFFKFQRKYVYVSCLNSDIIGCFEDFNKKLQNAIEYIEKNINNFDGNNDVIQRLVDMSAFNPTFEAMRNYLHEH